MKHRDNMNKKRHQSEVMWLYGKHAVKAALQNPQREVLRFVISENNIDFAEECRTRGVKTEIADKNFFAATFGKDATHQGCAVQVRKLPEVFIEDIIEDESDTRPIVFLDKVTDPQNVGSIMRAAAVFGARAIVVAEDNSPELTASAAKTASGAVEIIPIIRVTNLVHTIKDLKKKGFWCIGLDERGDKTINEVSLDGKFIFVIGSEGSGMRRLTRETCDFLVQLPCYDKFSTLNAAQAATVALYEILRQQRSK